MLRNEIFTNLVSRLIFMTRWINFPRISNDFVENLDFKLVKYQYKVGESMRDIVEKSKLEKKNFRIRRIAM